MAIFSIQIGPFWVDPMVYEILSRFFQSKLQFLGGRLCRSPFRTHSTETANFDPYYAYANTYGCDKMCSCFTEMELE